MKITRRRLMILGAVGAAGTAQALDQDGESGALRGGTMALSEAFKVADGVWIGPDSAKSTVAADSGNIYMASDTDVDYYGDGGSWVLRNVGSSSKPVPAVTTESLDNIFFAAAHGGANGREQIQNAINAADAATGDAGVIVGPEGPDSNGRYDIDQHIDPKGVALIEFRGNPLLRLEDAANDDIIRTADDNTGTTTEDLTIRGPVELDGNKANNSGDVSSSLLNQCGIRLVDVDGATLEGHIEAHDFVGYGCEIKLSTHVRGCGRFEFHNCDDDGLSVSDTLFSNSSVTRDVRIYGLDSHDNAGSGAEVDDGPRDVLIEGYSEANQVGFTINHHDNPETRPRNVRFKGSVVNCTDGAVIRARGSDSVNESHQYELDLNMRDITDRLVWVDIQDAEPAEDVTIDGSFAFDPAASPTEGIELKGAVQDVKIPATLNGNGVDATAGVRILSTEGVCKDINVSGIVRDFGREGVFLEAFGGGNIEHVTVTADVYNNGQDSVMGTSARSGVRTNQNTTNTVEELVVDAHVYDDQGTATQQKGVVLSDITDARISGIVEGHPSQDIEIQGGAFDTRIEATYGSSFDNGTRTRINGHAKEALGGSGPDATNYDRGDMVEDTENAGDVYLIIDPSSPGGFTQIAT